jgi:hypothetical protein
MEQTLGHVKLSGDRSGEYVVSEERPDGSLVLSPRLTPVEAMRRRHGLTPVSPEEFEEIAAHWLPPDGEG